MPLSPTLWDELNPPDVWIHVGSIDHDTDDHITVALRIKEAGRSSMTAHAVVTRYAPTDSIVVAVGKCLAAMAVAQKTFTRAELTGQLQASLRNHVDPF